MKLFYWMTGAVVIATLLAGCGGGSAKGERREASTASAPLPPPTCPPPSKQVRVSLDGRAGAENVGILMAKKRGFFLDEGLHVWVGSPIVPSEPVKYVATGIDDLGVAQQPQVVIAKEKGRGIISVSSLISQPTATLIWLKGSGVHEIADLAGKTIAVSGIPYQTAFLEEVLERAGLTPEAVKIEPVGYKLVPTLLKGKADAIFGGSSNLEGGSLKARGAEPVIAGVRSLGLPVYDELVVIARAECVKKYPQLIRRFVAAVVRGTEAALRDPRGAAQLIENNGEADPESKREEIEAQVRATLPLLSPTGRMDLSQASGLVDWMHAQGLIREEPPVSKLLTNAYLGR